MSWPNMMFTKYIVRTNSLFQDFKGQINRLLFNKDGNNYIFLSNDTYNSNSYYINVLKMGVIEWAGV